MNILLLAGGSSNEREVSLRSGQAVAAALDELGHDFTLQDPADAGFNIEMARDFEAVFLALHGSGGEDGVLQAELERLGVPFVGSDSKASKLCFDKWTYKELLHGHGVPATEGKVVTAQDIDDNLFSGPYVLKPVEGGSSLDTQVVRTPDISSKQASLNLLKIYPNMLLEPLVAGVEITVGILGEEPLPVIEIIPPEGKEFDYDNKYNGATQELCPPKHVGEDLQQQAQELALKIHKLTGCYSMSRTDMIIDASNNLHVLETNTIPGLTTQSLLPKMFVANGLTFAEGIDKLIQLAVNRPQ